MRSKGVNPRMIEAFPMMVHAFVAGGECCAWLRASGGCAGCLRARVCPAMTWHLPMKRSGGSAGQWHEPGQESGGGVPGLGEALECGCGLCLSFPVQVSHMRPG